MGEPTAGVGLSQPVDANARRIRPITRPGCFRRSCSQILSTRQPSLRSSRPTKRSRARLPVSLASQKDRLDLGRV